MNRCTHKRMGVSRSEGGEEKGMESNRGMEKGWKGKGKACL